MRSNGSGRPASAAHSPRPRSSRSEEHTSELQSHRDLHSFPTRRSSDLRVRAIVGVLVVAPAPEARVVAEATAHEPLVLGLARALDAQRLPRHVLGCVPTVRAARHPLPTRRGLVHRDRKSTRLNSSHTEIYTLSLHVALPICAYVQSSVSLSSRQRRKRALWRKRPLMSPSYSASHARSMRNGSHDMSLDAFQRFGPPGIRCPLAAASFIEIGRAHV